MNKIEQILASRRMASAFAGLIGLALSICIIAIALKNAVGS